MGQGFEVGPQFDRVHRIKLTSSSNKVHVERAASAAAAQILPAKRIGVSPPLGILKLLRSGAVMNRDRRS